MRAAALLLVLVGCYAPHPQAGARCAGGQCPAGLVCSPATDTCERQAIDAAPAVDTAPAIDAAPDVFVPPPDAGPSVRLVQQATNYSDQGATLTAVLPAPPASGDVLVFVGACPQAGLDGVTGGGASWTRATRSTVNTNEEIWWGVTDGSSASVTMALSTCQGPLWMSVTEWAGLATPDPIDAAHSVDGTTSPAAPGAITTTQANDLLILGVADAAPTTFGAPAPGAWTALAGTTGFVVQGVWYRVVAATGTYDPQVTETNGHWDAAIVALTLAP